MFSIQDLNPGQIFGSQNVNLRMSNEYPNLIPHGIPNVGKGFREPQQGRRPTHGQAQRFVCACVLQLLEEAGLF